MNDIRDYAYDLVNNGVVPPMTLITAMLKYMSNSEVMDMLVINDMAPSLSVGETQ